MYIIQGMFMHHVRERYVSKFILGIFLLRSFLQFLLPLHSTHLLTDMRVIACLCSPETPTIIEEDNKLDITQMFYYTEQHK